MPFSRAIPLLLLLGVCISAQPVAPGWLLVGPPSAQVQSFEYDPADSTIVYAAAVNGVYRSADGGSSWTLARATMGQYFHDVRVARSNPSIVYAASIFGLYRSADRGLTWSLTGTMLTSWYALAVSPTDANLVYGHTSRGFVLSEDGGQTLVMTGAGFPGGGRTVQSLVIDPNVPTTLYVSMQSGGPGVYQSTNGGAAWTANSVGLTGSSFYNLAAPSSPAGTLFLAGGDGLYRSTDSASTWTRVTSKPGLTYAVDAVGSTIVASSATGIQISADGGVTWGSPKLSLAFVVALNPHNPSEVLTVAQQRMYRSNDGGSTFQHVGAGMTSGGMSVITASRSDVPAVLAGGNFGLYKSDRGLTWTRLGIADILNVTRAELDPDDNSILYVVATGLIQRSIDGGATFVNYMTGLPGSTVAELAVDPTTSPRTLYAALGNAVYRRSGDQNWVATGSGLPTGTIGIVTVDAKNPATVYAGNASSIRRSRNSGTTWESMTLPSPLPSVIKDLLVDPNDSEHLVLLTSSRPSESTNGGSTWAELTALPMFSAVAFDPANNGQLYAHHNSGILRRAPGSSDWVEVFPTGARVSTTLMAISADGKSFYTGGSLGGVWVYRVDHRHRGVRK